MSPFKLAYKKNNKALVELSGSTYQVGGDFEVGKCDGFVLGDAPTFEVGHAKLVEGHDQFLTGHRHGCSSVHTTHSSDRL